MAKESKEQRLQCLWLKQKVGITEIASGRQCGRQMLGYRASSFFARLYCAAALNGINTEGEVNDINNREQPKDILA